MPRNSHPACTAASKVHMHIAECGAVPVTDVDMQRRQAYVCCASEIIAKDTACPHAMRGAYSGDVVHRFTLAHFPECQAREQGRVPLVCRYFQTRVVVGGRVLASLQNQLTHAAASFQYLRPSARYANTCASSDSGSRVSGSEPSCLQTSATSLLFLFQCCTQQSLQRRSASASTQEHWRYATCTLVMWWQKSMVGLRPRHSTLCVQTQRPGIAKTI